MFPRRVSPVFAVALAAMSCAPADSSPPADTSAGVPAIAVPTFGKAPPVDEAVRDPDFAAFRENLLGIVARRDSGALLALISPDIKNSFGGGGGPAEFREQWRIADPATDLWTILDDILRHGGRFAGPDVFYAPYTFQALPDSLDAFEHLVVRDSAVVVRDKPEVTSSALAQLSYDIVRAGPYAPESRWRAIVIGAGRVGYVRGDQIRSPIDYRAAFERRDGRWWLVFLVAGD